MHWGLHFVHRKMCTLNSLEIHLDIIPVFFGLQSLCKLMNLQLGTVGDWSVANSVDHNHPWTLEIRDSEAQRAATQGELVNGQIPAYPDSSTALNSFWRSLLSNQIEELFHASPAYICCLALMAMTIPFSFSWMPLHPNICIFNPTYLAHPNSSSYAVFM